MLFSGFFRRGVQVTALSPSVTYDRNETEKSVNLIRCSGTRCGTVVSIWDVRFG
jgi:hypothetical protein